jgi:hypothetical protein
MSEPKNVSRFEANLIRILRFFLRSLPATQAIPLIFQKSPRPRCLSRAAVVLVQDTLAKGSARLLAQGDGWRRERHLRSNQIAEGRLWERTPPRELGLHFSRHTLELLLWFTAENPADTKVRRRSPAVEELTPADALVCYHAYNALRDTEAGSHLATRLGFGGDVLCRLAFPADFTQRSAEPPAIYVTWTDGLGGCILEALQSELAGHWLGMERHKPQITNWRSMQSLGLAQERVVDGFLTALEHTGRHDLARFLLMTLAELLPEGVRASAWLGGLSEHGPRLADRSATHRAALVVPHQLQRLRRWELQARGVGYFDENYAAGQLWKAEWERWHGEDLCRRAEVLFREVDAFATEGTR